MVTRRSLLAASMAAGVLGPFDVAAAAEESSSGPVKMIVSFPAGGSTDVVIRAIAAQGARLRRRNVQPASVRAAVGVLRAQSRAGFMIQLNRRWFADKDMHQI